MILLIFELNMNIERLNTPTTNFDRPPINGLTSFRETQMRQSYVFSNAAQTQQRSFISTSLVNDTYAYGDDLRKYFL
jgi:biotin synthase-related radical SAM superfamily protein